MKNLFNNISQEEKNRILEMHSGKKNVISEQVAPQVAKAAPQLTQKPGTPQAGGLNYKVLADTLDKSMRGMGTDVPLLQSVINQIKTPQDWAKLNAAFGTRDGQNLDTWFRRDILDRKDWDKIIHPFYIRVGVDRDDSYGVSSGVSR
jgi:hypothetical protein